MRRYWKAYQIMLRNSLIREMSFKANFLLWIVVEICWFAGQIIFIEVLYSHVQTIGDWTKWQMILLVATHQLVGQLFQAFFFVNLAEIPERIRTGSLDFMLMLPLDAQFSVSTRQFGLDNIVNALVSLVIVGFALVQLGVQPGPGAVALYFTAIAFGIAIHYALMLTLTTVSFWIVRAQGLVSGYFSFSSLGRYPDVIFRGGLKFFFSWVIPIILVANVPARLLSGTFSGPVHQPLLHLALAALLVLAGSRLFWKFALSCYTSASS